MSEGLRLLKWLEWQRAAISDATRGRKKDPRIRRRLSYVAVAVDFDSDEFRGFAARVGGRSAETFWTRILQHVGKNAARTGFLPGINRRNFAQVLSRPHDQVKPATAAKVFDALVASQLAAVEFASPSAMPAPVPEGVTAPVPGQYTERAPSTGAAPTGPPKAGQGVTAEPCIKACDSLASSEVDVEENREPVVDAAVAVDRPAAPTSGHDGNGALKRGACHACRNGLVRRPGAKPRTCDCTAGLERRLRLAKSKADDEAQAGRAAAALGESRRGLRGAEPLSAILARLSPKSLPSRVPP